MKNITHEKLLPNVGCTTESTSIYFIILAGLPARTQYPFGKDLVTTAPPVTHENAVGIFIGN